MAIAAYIRVSTHEQTLEVQQAEITRWLQQHDYDPELIHWYSDKQTGKHLQRDGFEQLQQAIFQGDVDTVIVWRLDRVSRSMKDGVKVVADWMEKNVRLISVTQGFDWSGVMGQMIAAILFAFAEMELVTMKERQAAGIVSAKAKGKYTGRKSGTTKAKPKEAKRLRANGLTIPQIAKALDVSVSTVNSYLRA